MPNLGALKSSKKALNDITRNRHVTPCHLVVVILIADFALNDLNRKNCLTAEVHVTRKMAVKRYFLSVKLWP